MHTWVSVLQKTQVTDENRPIRAGKLPKNPLSAASGDIPRKLPFFLYIVVWQYSNNHGRVHAWNR